MADTPISLSKHRKARARIEKRKRADENAVKYGRTKAEKAADRQDTTRMVAKLDGHRRDDASED